MNAFGSSRPYAFGITFLGVHFYWPSPEPGFDHDNLQSFDESYHRILDIVGESMRRQKRTYLTYCDAMTYLEDQGPPESVAESAEAELADRLILMLARNRHHPQTVRELTEVKAFDAAQSRLAYHGGKLSDEFELFTSRSNPARIEFGANGKTRKARPDFYRLLDMDMQAVGMKANAIDWDRLMILAVLLQIRADLEVYYETGFQRLRKCEHGRCGAWFLVNRMAGRQRFCSTLCRVTEARDEARDRATSRRRRKA